MTAAHGPVVVRRRLGSALKRLRTDLDLRLDVIARRMEISPSKLSRLETGQVAPRIRDVRDLLDIYEVPADVRSRMMRWANEAKEPGWWQPFADDTLSDLDLYISLEAESRAIKMFSTPIAGLLQTPAYMRALLDGALPDATPAELHRLVEIRVLRQQVLDPARTEVPPVELHAVLDESALHRGSDAGMLLEQLQHLVARSVWPNVVLQVLPFDAGWTQADSTFAIFEPREPTDSTVVNIESTGQDTYVDTNGEVAKYTRIWNDLVERALDPARSLDVITGATVR